MKNTQNTVQKEFSKVVSAILGLPWADMITEAWKYVKKVLQDIKNDGMYETLRYESTLEILDTGGHKARFTKRKHVRYLQDNIIAYQDYAWGDGKILRYYRCSPGKPVDFYRSGYKTYILISLHEVKNRGDEDIFDIQWLIRDGFLVPDGFWETDISQKTRYLRVNVIFPRERHPMRVMLIESNRKRTHILGKENRHRLPDGRLQVTWEKKNPKLYENYLIKWRW